MHDCITLFVVSTCSIHTYIHTYIRVSTVKRSTKGMSAMQALYSLTQSHVHVPSHKKTCSF